MVKMDMLVNGEPVDAFSFIVQRDRPTHAAGPRSKLKEVIQPHLFKSPSRPRSAARSSRART